MLAHFILEEKLHIFGVLGCVLCVVGSTSIVLHAPKERDIESVKQLWRLTTQPGISPVKTGTLQISNSTPWMSWGCCAERNSLLATGFIVYTVVVLIVVGVLIFCYAPRYGPTNMMVYIGICSLMGSLTVSVLSSNSSYIYFSKPQWTLLFPAGDEC